MRQEPSGDILIYTMKCGCQWPIIGPASREGGLPLLDVDINHLPDCPLPWDMMSKGITKGVFQLESRLGSQWSKRLRPRNNEHLSALGALLRPGCLMAKDENGISMTEHYCRRVNKEESADSFHPALDEILGSTEQIMIYQEQAMQIGAKIAGFDLKDVDRLRKAIGKKDQREMGEVKKLFLEGATRQAVVPEKMAAEIWGWIEKSGRYSFNRSHSMSYGMTGYDTAYLKSHFPVQFYTSWLSYAEDKVKPDLEVMELVEDARRQGVLVLPPDVRQKEAVFHTDGVDIYFGIGNIKGLGGTGLVKMLSRIKEIEESLDKPLAQWCWYDWLLNIGSMSVSISQRLAMAGALDWFGVKRQRMLAELEVVSSMTDKELEYLAGQSSDHNTTFSSALKAMAKTKKEGGGCANAKRVSLVRGQADLLESPPTPLNDNPAWMAWAEEQVFGFPLTCTRVDGCDLGDANTTVGEFLAGKTGFLLLGVEIRSIRIIRTKKGTEMAFLSLADSSGVLDDATCFSEALEEYRHLLTQGNTVLVQGGRDKKRKSLLINKVFQLA